MAMHGLFGNKKSPGDLQKVSGLGLSVAYGE
jgi:hypothetical protein